MAFPEKKQGQVGCIGMKHLVFLSTVSELMTTT